MTCRSGSKPMRGAANDVRRVIPLREVHVAQENGAFSCCGGGCRAAVTRPYRELRDRGVSDLFAFEAGLRLYNLRHPEAPQQLARDSVADWISDHLGQ